MSGDNKRLDEKKRSKKHQATMFGEQATSPTAPTSSARLNYVWICRNE